MANKSQTKPMKQMMNQGPEIDNLMAKFNNSLALQSSNIVTKSRNLNQSSFKTTASIGSNNLKNSTIKTNNIVIDSISSGGHTKKISQKFNQTIGN